MTSEIHQERGLEQAVGLEEVTAPTSDLRLPHSSHSNASHLSTTLHIGETRQQRRRSWSEAFEEVTLNLTPSFFSLNMGTGIASILLHNLPYNAQWLRILGIVVFVLNIAIFAVLSLFSIVRYVRWKGLFTASLVHPLASMFWGTLPMGLTTIVNMIAFVCVPAWGYRWAQLALGLWWIDVLIAILVNFGLIFAMFTRQTHSQDTISAALLLPIVSTVVAASSGGVVAGAIAPFDPHLARSTVIVSYVVWGTGVPVALFFITMWIHHTIIGGVPSAAALPTLFLPLGPCGQGSYGIILLGHVTRNLAYTHNIGFTILPEGISSADAMLRIADAVYASCLVTGLILWGLALVWYTVAMTITIDHGLRNKVYFAPRNFSIGWTAYTFPIGVWATATNQLAIEFGSPAFKVIGTAVSVQVILQWAYVFAMCCIKAWQGTIFVAPEVSKWEGRPPLRFPSRKPGELGKLGKLEV